MWREPYWLTTAATDGRSASFRSAHRSCVYRGAISVCPNGSSKVAVDSRGGGRGDHFSGPVETLGLGPVWLEVAGRTRHLCRIHVHGYAGCAMGPVASEIRRPGRCGLLPRNVIASGVHPAVRHGMAPKQGLQRWIPVSG